VTDRQTDHATDKCVGIGGIACAAGEIPPKYRRLMAKNLHSLTLVVRLRGRLVCNKKSELMLMGRATASV